MKNLLKVSLLIIFTCFIISCSGQVEQAPGNQNLLSSLSFELGQDNDVVYYMIPSSGEKQYIKQYNTQTGDSSVIQETKLFSKFKLEHGMLYYMDYITQEESQEIGIYRKTLENNAEPELLGIINENLMMIRNCYFNVIDGDVYVRSGSLYKFDSTGNLVFKNETAFCTIEGNKIYYTEDFNNLYTMSLDGTNRQLCLSREQIFDGKIDSWYLRWLNSGGWIDNVVLYQGDIYFILQDGQRPGMLYKYNPEKKQLREISVESLFFKQFQIYEDKLYFIGKQLDKGKEPDLFQCNLDGSNLKEIEKAVKSFCIQENYLYVSQEHDLPDYEYKFYQMKLDGSNKQLIDQSTFKSE